MINLVVIELKSRPFESTKGNLGQFWIKLSVAPRQRNQRWKMHPFGQEDRGGILFWTNPTFVTSDVSGIVLLQSAVSNYLTTATDIWTV